MSKILAIKGDKERGNDVIALLEMLGGHCDELLSSGNRNEEDYFYFILKEEKNVIDAFPLSKKELFEHDVQIFTLDEFYEKYPYKVGDEVIIKRKNKEAVVDKVNWCCDTVTYWLKYDGFIEGNWIAEHLQPYKELL